MPLLFRDVRMRQDDEAWRLRRQWEFGKRFLYRWNDADRLFFRARAAVALLALRCWPPPSSSGRAGTGACPRPRLALLLCVLSPDVLAHGQIVSTDLGAALFIFLAVVAFERATERATWGRVLAAGAALGAALATKYSAWSLLPVLGALAARPCSGASRCGWRSRAPDGDPRAGRSPRRVLDVLLVLAIMAAVALARDLGGVPVPAVLQRRTRR